MWNGIQQPLGIGGQWKLILNSTFSRRKLDTSVWRVGWFAKGVTGPANKNEDDCYSPANVTLPGDGSLHLSVTETPSTCRTGHYPGTYPFTGALISTNPHDGRARGGFQYTYGVLQARIYVPLIDGGVANWPTFWADGQKWPADGEDDVFEGLYGDACFHFHNVAHQYLALGGCLHRLGVGWHTFASEWTPRYIKYFYDGRLVRTVRGGITGAPMFIIVNNTVRRGYPLESEPDVMKVSYVRVWQQAT